MELMGPMNKMKRSSPGYPICARFDQPLLVDLVGGMVVCEKS